jgi:primosomal protein N'
MAPTMPTWYSVVVATPAHSGLGPALSYRSELSLAPGTLVRVPLGAREVLGVVWDGRVAHHRAWTRPRVNPCWGRWRGWRR